MNKALKIILNNLSGIAMFIVYLTMVIIHLAYDSFIAANQYELLVTMLPFILYGLILDYILRSNNDLGMGLKTFSRLLPIGIFVMQLITSILTAAGKETFEVFYYLIWIFLSLPFAIGSYQKVGFRKRFIFSLIGTALILAAYVYLTTQTDALDGRYGAIVYFMTYLMMIYSTSGIRKIPFLGIIIGALNAMAMILYRFFPNTAAAKYYGWDYDIFGSIEMLILVTLMASVMIRMIETVQAKPKE